MIHNKLKSKESMFSAKQMETEFRVHEKFKKQLSKKHFNRVRLSKMNLSPIPQEIINEKSNVRCRIGLSQSPELYKSLSDRGALQDNDFNISDIKGSEITLRHNETVSP